MLDTLITTKLFVPPTRPIIVHRDRLLARLTNGLHRKLTLISAPAGFGKTTLVTDWLASISVSNQIAWISLDESDNDPVRFISYLIAALENTEVIGPDFVVNAMDRLQSLQYQTFEAVLSFIVNEITKICDQIVLVLDDYHLITNQAIHDVLIFLIEFQPQQLHIVLSTREDPLFSLSRLRSKDQLTELRAADLRFSVEEIAEFLNIVMGLKLDPGDINALESRTEGWIAGLQLAALSMQGSEDVSTFIKTFTGSHRLVMDYLIEEVLENQSGEIQDFLLKTSILNKLCSSLCNAVIDRNVSQQVLEKLDHANLFVIPLDGDRKWYRYHHLFTDLLNQKLHQFRREELPNLHRKASEWYEQEGFFQDAIYHAVAGKDYDHVASLAEKSWTVWNTPTRLLTWVKWVDILPDEIIYKRPVLGTSYAQALLNAGQLEAAEKRLNDVEELLDKPEAHMIIIDHAQFSLLPAKIATTRAYHAQAIGDVESAVNYVEKALSLYPEDDAYNRAVVKGFMGLSYWSNGDLEKAYQVFTRGLFQNDHDQIKGTFVVANMKRDLGQLHEAIRICEQGINLAESQDPPMPTGSEDIYSCLGELYLEQGELEKADQCLAKAKSLGDKVDLPDWKHRWCIASAQLECSLGHFDAAHELLKEAERLFVRTPIPDLHPIPAKQARVWIKQGRLVDGQYWADERNLRDESDPGYMHMFEAITLARLYLAQEKLEQADKLLGKLQMAAEEGSWIRYLIEILIVRSMVCKKLDQGPSAHNYLTKAFQLAEPENFIQVFVDEGPDMAVLLVDALSKDVDPHFIQRLLAAFPVFEKDQSVIEAEDGGWIEPLSEREVEILQFIAEGLTNQEIASQAFLTLNTVKAHTRNIYAKLGVNSRTQAVAKARALGFL